MGWGVGRATEEEGEEMGMTDLAQCVFAGLKEVGIFRLPGQSRRVQALKELYDQGGRGLGTRLGLRGHFIVPHRMPTGVFPIGGCPYCGFSVQAVPKRAARTSSAVCVLRQVPDSYEE